MKMIKYSIILLVVLLSSCATKPAFISEFNCVVESFSNLEKIEDVKKLFTVQYPDTWKTNLYYDKNQSSIFTADTTKQLKETMLLDITHISNQLKFDANFTKKFNSNLLKQQLEENSSGTLTFKDKEAYYSLATGIKRTFKYHILTLFIKLDEKNYINSTIEVFGDSLVNQRICKGINLVEKITY
jgi:hypothetical protein